MKKAAPIKKRLADAHFSCRINRELKDEAVEILQTSGISLATFLKMALTKVTHDGHVPFELLKKTESATEREARLTRACIAANARTELKEVMEDWYSLVGETLTEPFDPNEWEG
jgi:addiction module RelB/DinJ family antitoxin